MEGRNRNRNWFVSSNSKKLLFRNNRFCDGKIIRYNVLNVNKLLFFLNIVVHSFLIVVEFLQAFLKFASSITGIELLFSLDTDSLRDFVLIDFEDGVNDHISKGWKE